ncbi:PepSY domain-containing protein [Idiomarina seosinensis]|uniref:PepSY domain-containing protein n=1 Tax=Idiomarina seosinensis TaxID=281739 RepID=A0A432ZDT7_9GAMM|nr:PepSY domain-containing protein [Idiomarina seosinensis]RUO76133.1 PepSY domain-containing protein [Idiomarina seosinensis]
MTKLKVLTSATALVLLAACSAEESVTQCTTASQTEWMDQEQFQAGLEQEGYEINEFKVTPGSCYEVYGKNRSGEKVEIYFNPVDGSVVKQEVE